MDERFDIPRNVEMKIRYYLYSGLVSDAQILVRKYATEVVSPATVIEKTNSYEWCPFVRLWRGDELIREIPFAHVEDMSALAYEIILHKATRFTTINKRISREKNNETIK